MLQQYFAAKRQHPDALLFFRMGDFFELFFEDAKVAAKVLGIALTSRSKEQDVPMAGVPVRTVDAYLRRLIQAGHQVVVCDQVEKALSAASTAASTWVCEASGRSTILPPVRGFRMCSSASVPASKRDPISSWVSMSVLP